MKNPKMFQVQFNMNYGGNNCALHALIKTTEHPQKFHILRLQPLNPRENASVIDDFYIAKILKDNAPVWVHAESENSSTIVQAIGSALDKHNVHLLP
jgi:hypothetical protein